MPTYEYHCDACEHTFDEFQSMSDKPLRKCPKCGKLKLRRAFGIGAAVLFKGSGFYQTDYRSESYKSAAKADEPKPAAEKTETSKDSGTSAAKQHKAPKSKK
jgi:putative FmdB family regulatory protein